MTERAGDPKVDVESMHRGPASTPLRREAEEPSDGNEPPPWWLWVVSITSLFIAGFYLGRHWGGFSAMPHIGWATTTQAPSTRPELARPASGAELYAQRCASCHQADGRGLPNAYPPLVGSEWVVGAPEVPVRIVLLGLVGPINVAGQNYNGAMPAWGPMMTDAEIANVLTYVRELSNAPAITEELVAREREATTGAAGPLTPEALQPLTKEPR